LLDDAAAGVRPQAEDAAGQILGQVVHDQPGEPGGGSIGIVAEWASQNFSQSSLGGHNQPLPEPPAEDAYLRTDFLIFCELKVQGAKELLRMTNPDGTIGHTELRIGDSVVMLGQASEQWKAMPCMLYLYVTDVDALYRRAVQAGGVSIKEPQDQFYGDRTAGVQDKNGNQWWLGMHIEDVSTEELQRRHAAARGGQAAG